MLKFYLESVCIYFLVFIATGILFKSKFVNASEKIRKVNKDTSKRAGIIVTTLLYLVISFIPVVRFLCLYGKIYMTFWTDSYIELLKETKEKKNDRQSNKH